MTFRRVEVSGGRVYIRQGTDEKQHKENNSTHAIAKITKHINQSHGAVERRNAYKDEERQSKEEQPRRGLSFFGVWALGL